MFRSTIFAIAASVAAAGPAISAPAAASKQHKFGTFTVIVAPDIAATPTAADYEITVEKAEFLLSRLTAPYHGMLSNSFVADLNNDGGFEVVVTFTTGDGHDTGIKVFSWKEDLLQPLKVADLDDAQKQGYRGDDEFAVIEGKLIRVFQVYEQLNGEWSATASRRKLSYSFENSRWIIQ